MIDENVGVESVSSEVVSDSSSAQVGRDDSNSQVTPNESQDKVSDTPKEPVSSDKPKYKNIRSALRANLKSNPESASQPDRSAVPAEAQAPQVEESVLPPNDMKAEELSVFNKLPPDLKKYISRRAYETNTTFLNKTRELSEEYKSKINQVDPLLNVVRQYGDEYAREGISETDIVRRSIAWDRALRTSDPAAKMAAATQFLQSYGLDPADIVLQGETTDYSQQQQQPQLTAEQIKQELRNELLAEREQVEAEYILQDSVKTATEFLNSVPFSKDPGSLAQLEQAMAPIVYAIKQQAPETSSKEILQRAYDYVTKGDPRFAEIRQRYEAKPLADKTRDTAQKAMFASRSISGGPGSGGPTQRDMSMRENLRWRFSGGN